MGDDLMDAKAPQSTIVTRRGPLIQAEKSRVLLRRLYPCSHEKARIIVDRLVALTPVQVAAEYSVIMEDWGDRHGDLEAALRHRFREVISNLQMQMPGASNELKCLIGAYFTHEYSIESAALFNPSIVPHPDQSNLAEGCLRFIMSLRATGEGHISSVTFREGVVGAHNRVSLLPSATSVSEAKRQSDDRLKKSRFVYELHNAHGITKPWTPANESVKVAVLAQLKDAFSLGELRQACSKLVSGEHPLVADRVIVDETVQSLLLLAEANYTVVFDPSTKMSQRVLFPSAPSQSNGIEDARFVQFVNDDGSKIYYATFTAYNGRSALPQLIETPDFNTIRFIALQGNAISNKGMALFPRKVGGKYWMLSRQDDENILIMSSESLLRWDDPVVLMAPQEPWEAFKMGNCGSPIETPKGWIVLTHAVGPMRRYCIGAAILALDDPRRVIGRMREPLIAPNESEREGYVPNVVYSCGALLHNGREIILPYAMSDSATSFATVSLERLYTALGV